jgi:hypothetical protein
VIGCADRAAPNNRRTPWRDTSTQTPSIRGASTDLLLACLSGPGELGLFIANADGTDEHPLLSPPDVDYDPAWSADGAWIAFTSERNGSADI